MSTVLSLMHYRWSPPSEQRLRQKYLSIAAARSHGSDIANDISPRHNVLRDQSPVMITGDESRPMARKAQDVTDAELAILEELWEGGPQSVRSLAEKLYQSASTSNTATVQKLLGRLESKGFVGRDQSVWPRLFNAQIERGELIGRRLQITADDLCEGSMGPLLTHLVRSGKLSRTERAKLKSLLNDLDQPN